MKNFTQIIFIFLFVITCTYAQQEKGIIGTSNWLSNWTEFQPSEEDYDEPTQILTGIINEDLKLVKRNVYLLVGSVIVTNKAVLTIEPGTVIIGDYQSNGSLTIARGAGIIANGLETDPIIFTSNRSVKRAGDWGGITILGDAPTNKFGNGSVANFHSKLDISNYAHTNYGGESINSNSGVLKYVRVEYAGKRISNGDYFNGLLLAGVGRETVVENVMISYCGGNSLEVWGGSVDLDKIVSYRSHNNDFKFNFGTQCNLSNSLALRDPYISNNTGSKCLTVRSYDTKEEVDLTKKLTTLKAKNITLLNTSKSIKEDIKMGLVSEAVYVGENASLDMNKSVISGFNPAVIFEDKIRVNQASLEKIKFSEMYFNNCNGNIFVENNSNNEDLENWYGNHAFFNVYSKSPNAETFIDSKNEKRPDFRLRINKIIASNEIDTN